MTVKLIKAKHTPKKQRVCAYVRVSTTNSSQLDSLQNQIAYFTNLYGNRDDVTFVGVYHDKGISGSTDYRPSFQAMIEDCRKGQIDLIHTKSISRFARSTMTILEVSRELKVFGVGIYF
ncbi:recombinase family protein, partial [Streptococcus suis]|nr:recombinase family protein [Streptococcus suis]